MLRFQISPVLCGGRLKYQTFKTTLHIKTNLWFGTQVFIQPRFPFSIELVSHLSFVKTHLTLTFKFTPTFLQLSVFLFRCCFVMHSSSCIRRVICFVCFTQQKFKELKKTFKITSYLHLRRTIMRFCQAISCFQVGQQFTCWYPSIRGTACTFTKGMLAIIF